MSIRLKLTYLYTGILALVFLLFGLGLYFFLSYSLYNGERAELKLYGEDVNAGVKLVNYFGILRIQFPDLDAFQSSGTFLQGITENGEVTTSSNLMGREMPFPPNILQQIKESGGGFHDRMELGGYTFLVYYQPLSYEDNLIGVLQISRMVGDIEQFLQNLKYILMLVGMLMIGLAATVGWFMARKTLQPIETVIDATRNIQNSEDLRTKIVYHGPADEIGRLTDTINSMLTRIQQSYFELAESIQAQRRFVADASHELRTPLTTIRGNVDLVRKMEMEEHGAEHLTAAERAQLKNEALRDIAEEAERMTRLINDMLTLARSDSGVQFTKQPVRLASVIEEVTRKAQFLPRAADWQVGQLDELQDVYVCGNEDYLQQLFYIFIENAFKYTQAGFVRLEAVRTEEQVGIRISDTGIGIDAEQVPLIFERFYRVDPSRGITSGTGLGLSIARWILDEHKGSVEVSTLKGEGTSFLIWLPIHLVDEA